MNWTDRGSSTGSDRLVDGPAQPSKRGGREGSTCDRRAHPGPGPSLRTRHAPVKARSRSVRLVPALPSLSLLGDEVKDELAAQQRRFDALDSKAGVVVGFAGVLVPLSLANLHGTLAHLGTGAAALAALLAAVAFVPRRTPVLNVRQLRENYLASSEDFTKLRILDSRVLMYETASATVERKANLVTAAVVALGLAVIVTVIAGIFFQ
jgi:hypothetical protein